MLYFTVMYDTLLFFLRKKSKQKEKKLKYIHFHLGHKIYNVMPCLILPSSSIHNSRLLLLLCQWSIVIAVSCVCVCEGLVFT